VRQECEFSPFHKAYVDLRQAYQLTEFPLSQPEGSAGLSQALPLDILRISSLHDSSTSVGDSKFSIYLLHVFGCLGMLENPDLQGFVESILNRNNIKVVSQKTLLNRILEATKTYRSISRLAER